MALVISREATIKPSPCEAALNNPGETRNLERSLFALDDLQVPSVAPQLPSKLAALVPSISNDGTNSRPERREASYRAPTDTTDTIAVLAVLLRSLIFFDA